MPSITSANAVFMLAITGLFPIPQQLQEFAADDIFDTDPLEATETSMGVDGHLTGGFVFVPVKQGISLQADSASNAVFDTWFETQKAQKDVFAANGIITLPALGKKWTMTRGFLTTYPPLPNSGRTLKARKFGITWESFSPAPL